MPEESKPFDFRLDYKDYRAGTFAYRWKTPVDSEDATHPGRAEAFLTLCHNAPDDAVILPVGLQVKSWTYCDTDPYFHNLGVDYQFAHGWNHSKPHEHKWVVETAVSCRAFEHVDEDHMDVVYSYGMKNRTVRCIVKQTYEEWIDSLKVSS